MPPAALQEYRNEHKAVKKIYRSSYLRNVWGRRMQNKATLECLYICTVELWISWASPCFYKHWPHSHRSWFAPLGERGCHALYYHPLHQHWTTPHVATVILTVLTNRKRHQGVREHRESFDQIFGHLRVKEKAEKIGERWGACQGEQTTKRIQLTLKSAEQRL